MTEDILEDSSFFAAPSVILAPAVASTESGSNPLNDDPLGVLAPPLPSSSPVEDALISFGEEKSSQNPSSSSSSNTPVLDGDLLFPSDSNFEAPSVIIPQQNGSTTQDLFDPLFNPATSDMSKKEIPKDNQELVDASPLFATTASLAKEEPSSPIPTLTPTFASTDPSSTSTQQPPLAVVISPTAITEPSPLSPTTTIDRARLNELLGVAAEAKSSSTTDLLGLEEEDLLDFKNVTKASPSSSASSLLTPSTSTAASSTSALGEDFTSQTAVSSSSSSSFSSSSSSSASISPSAPSPSPSLSAPTTAIPTPSPSSSSSAQSLGEFNDPLLNPVVQPKIEEPPPPPPPRKLLFEHFLVVGLPTDAKIETGRPTFHDPQILYQYPPDKKLAVPKVPMFCFPEGVKTTVARRTNSLSNLNEIFYGQSYLHSSENSFVFILTGIDNAYLYGMCVTKHELLREAPSFLQKTKAPVVGNRFIVAPRCYCLLSRYPFFNIHFEVLYSILAQERLIRIHRDYSANLPSLHTSASSPAIVGPTDSSSPSSTSSSLSTSSLDPLQALPVEDPLSAPTSPIEGRMIVADSSSSQTEVQETGWDVTEILERYYYTPVPEAGETTKITFPNGLQPITFSCPRGDTDARVLADWCLHCTFRILSLENILRLFTGLMLEKPIVIVCKNLGLLSTVVLSLIPLLRPLVWQGLLVPILPAVMQDMLQAPVPYLAGIQTLPEKLRAQLSETMVVYLDTNEVISSLPLLPLPEEKKLQENLRHFHTMLYRPERTNQNPLNISQEQLSVVHSLLASVNRYTTWFMESISSHFRACVIGGTHESDLIKASFLQKISPHNRPFVQLFLDTQHFSVFIDTILRRSRGGPSSSSSS